MNGVRVKTEVEDSGYVSNQVNGMASYGVNVKTEVADSVGLVGGNCAPIPTSDEISCCNPALFDMHCYFDPVLYASLNYPEAVIAGGHALLVNGFHSIIEDLAKGIDVRLNHREDEVQFWGRIN